MINFIRTKNLQNMHSDLFKHQIITNLALNISAKYLKF